MSFSTIYPSPSKIDGVRPGNHLGLNGDVSYDHTISSPEQVLRVGNSINEQFYRVDTLGLKKRLLSSIGGEEEASEYWQSLAQFLKGKMRRDEFETLVKPVLNTSLKRQLHNQLLMAIMYNATSPLPIALTPTLPSDPSQSMLPQSESIPSANSLKRSLNESEAADIIQPKTRVRQWALSLPRSERRKIKGLQDMDGRYGLKDWCEMSRGWQGRGRVRSTDKLAQTEALRQTDSALCMSARAIPPVADLDSRIRDMAYLYGLQEGVADELGSFMSIALEYHMNNLISSAIELKRHHAEEEKESATRSAPMEVDPTGEAQEAPTQQSPDNVSDSLQLEIGDDEIRPEENVSAEAGPSEPVAEGNVEMPQPTHPVESSMQTPPPDKDAETITLSLTDLEDFFTIAPHIHPHAGSATYRLRNGLARAVEEQERLAEELMKKRNAETEDELTGNNAFTLVGIPDASTRSVLASSSATTPQAATRSATPLSIYRKGAPSVLPNMPIPKIEISTAESGPKSGATANSAAQAVPYSPNTPRAPTIGEGGIVISRSTRSTLAFNPTEAFRAEMEARGILKSMDRAAGSHGGVANAHSVIDPNRPAEGYELAERQLHGHHWNYVDPAVILKDILG